MIFLRIYFGNLVLFILEILFTKDFISLVICSRLVDGELLLDIFDFFINKVFSFSGEILS